MVTAIFQESKNNPLVRRLRYFLPTHIIGSSEVRSVLQFLVKNDVMCQEAVFLSAQNIGQQFSGSKIALNLPT